MVAFLLGVSVSLNVVLILYLMATNKLEYNDFFECRFKGSDYDESK